MSTATTTRPSTTAPAPPEPRRRRSIPWRALFLALLGLLFLTPLLWMATTSLKSTAEVSSADLTFLPKNPTTEGYSTILGAPQTPVAQWFLNSMIAATAQTLLVLVVATMAAYALARLSFPGGIKDIEYTGFAGPTFGNALTLVKFMNAIGPDNVTPDTHAPGRQRLRRSDVGRRRAHGLRQEPDLPVAVRHPDGDPAVQGPEVGVDRRRLQRQADRPDQPARWLMAR